MTPRREPSKCREWEKIRRDKLNTGFTVLSKLLPNHDPSLTWSKLDILQKASQYIEELQTKLKNVLTTEGVNKTKHSEIKMLYGRVKKLLLRNEQLSNLLKDAGIKIPSAYGSVKHFREPLRWANTITPEQAKQFEKEETQKENKETKKVKRPKRNLKKVTNVAIKHRKKDGKKLKIASKEPAIISLQLSNVLPVSVTHTLTKVSSQSCFIITNTPPVDLSLGLQQNGKKKAPTVVTNSSSLAGPKMASTVKPPTSTSVSKVTTTTLNSLGPGTLILANGNIVPILPPPTVLPPSTITPILLKPSSNNTTLIVMPTNNCKTQMTKPVTTSTNSISVHPNIRPKINITCTTQSNKVPIPAISSRFRETATSKPTSKKKDEAKTETNKKLKRKVPVTISPTSVQNKKIKVTTETPTTTAEENKESSKMQTTDINKVNEIPETAVNAEPQKQVPLEVAVVSKTGDTDKSPNLDVPNSSATPAKDADPGSSSKVNPEPLIADNVVQPEAVHPDKTPEEKVPIPTTTTSSNTELAVNLNHSELSNDLFSTLQVPIGGQNPESTSPTAAFLLAFPLVSSLTGVKVTEVIEEENSDSRHGTPTLLQIGTMDTTKTTQSVHTESLTPNLLNLDNFSFFSGNNFYSSFDSTANCPIMENNVKTTSACAKITEVTAKVTAVTNSPIYTSDQQVSKPSVPVISNSFPQQSAAIVYSKPAPAPPPFVTSSYMQNAIPPINCPTTSRKSDAPVSIAQCNAFNPFSDFSKANSYATFSKPYNDPLYTNSSYTYPHHNDNNFNQNVYYPPKAKPNNSYNAPNYSGTPYNVTDNRKRHVSYYNQTKPTTKQSTKPTKVTTNQPKPPINWMTTPDFRSQPSGGDYLVPSIDYNSHTFYSSNSTHTTYFNTTSSMYPSSDFQNSITDNRKTFDASLPILPTNSSQRNEYEENQFSWSPTKLPQFLDTPHTFVSSTLPTLVGDLALGTTQTPFADQKVEQTKSKDGNRRAKVHSVTYDNQSNFLSVSQLVENKTDASSARSTNRRNSGNRNVKSNSQKKTPQKTSESKELLENAPIEKKGINYTMQNIENTNWMADCTKPNRHVQKNPQSSYSAEALIGHQDHTDMSAPKHRYRQQTGYPTSNKALPIPTFLSDNIVPYFPPVEIPQENNFMQANPSYQSFNTSMQNNSYSSSGPTITSNYLQPSGLIPDFQNYPSMIPEADKIDNKHCNRNDPIKPPSLVNRSTEERLNIVHQVNNGGDCSSSTTTTTTNNFMKKKHKQPNDPLPGIVDFGFLSMPSTINSPILPDDFHAHSNFLPPPTPSQLYPCKNPLYPKQASDLLPLPPVPVTKSGPQNFDGPTGVTGNPGSSLTSFNLSAIFPEINKGSMPLPGLYPDPAKNKNYNLQRNYIGSSVQMFNCKSTSSTSYANSLSTSYAPSN